jgi:hypothetical protein
MWGLVYLHSFDLRFKASLCITAMKESMFGKGDADGALDDTDDEWERSQVRNSFTKQM